MGRSFARLVALGAFASAMAVAAPAWAVVDIKVDLGTQTLTATRSDGTSVTWPVSTGRQGFETPEGTYGVERLDKDHVSSEYGPLTRQDGTHYGAKMPNTIAFKGGYAIHGTFDGGLGRPASHGCVRLSLGHSATLFGWVGQEGARITVAGSYTAVRGHRQDWDGGYGYDRFSSQQGSPEAVETFADQQRPRAGGWPQDDPPPRRRRPTVSVDGYGDPGPVVVPGYGPRTMPGAGAGYGYGYGYGE